MKRMIVIALALLVPALAQAKDKWTAIGSKDNFIRQLVSQELNTRRIAISGTSHYTLTSIKGQKLQQTPTNPMFGSTTLVKFTAQPSVKLKVDGKTRTVKLGGCTGECKVGSIMCRPPELWDLRITSLLR